MRVLIIEDDSEVAEFLSKGLSEHGHAVEHAADGKQGLLLAGTGEFDVIVLDRMLPELDGLSVLKRLRAAEVNTPVLILSALGDVDKRVEGLRAGGDDYLTKPFSFSELLARVEVLQRRQSSAAEPEPTTLSVGDLTLDLLARSATRADQRIDLQPREYRLLEYLMRHAGQVVTRTMLLEQVWDYNFDPQTNVIDVHISRLRSKIDRNFDEPLLHTVRGAGYMINVTP